MADILMRRHFILQFTKKISHNAIHFLPIYLSLPHRGLDNYQLQFLHAYLIIFKRHFGIEMFIVIAFFKAHCNVRGCCPHLIKCSMCQNFHNYIYKSDD